MRLLKTYVVEDEMWVRRGIIFRLSQMNDIVSLQGDAPDYETAICAIRALPELDLLFTDIVLPTTNGLKLIQEAKQIHPSLCVYIISGYAEFEFAQQAINLGVDGYILKPINMDALSKAVEATRLLLRSVDDSTDLVDSTVIVHLSNINYIPDAETTHTLLFTALSKLDKQIDISICLRSIKQLLDSISQMLMNCGFDALIETDILYEYQRKYYSNPTVSAWVDYILADLENLLHYYRRQSEDSILSTMRLVKQYIYLHYKENISLESLSQQFALSSTYLSRIFKATYHEGISTLLTRLRIESACALLKDSTLSIYLIAEQLNFSDVSYFSKVFRRYMGITPGEYRKNILHHNI
ncbi:hypothetical protein AGMMS49992_17170 [Clostridia bacterium]|nr:hypothetical protein AGMMS49992_17170 [Clostridia bacterium]